MKKWVIVVIVFVIVSLIIGVYLILPKEKEDDELDMEKEEYDLELCVGVVLSVQTIDCESGESGISVKVLRRDDDLGQGVIRMSATDIDGEIRTLKKLNFSQGVTELNMNNAVAGESTNVVLELEIVKNGKKILCPGVNENYSCISEVNLSGNLSESVGSSVPTPTGSVKVMDMVDNFGEGYFCDNNTNPKHRVRVYAFKKINGTDVLSDEYIESEKVDDVCDYYPDVDGLYYDLKWEWGAVVGVDGYVLYQYYSLGNISREYDYSVRVLGNNLLRDTGLGLWRQVG